MDGGREKMPRDASTLANPSSSCQRKPDAKEAEDGSSSKTSKVSGGGAFV